MNKHIDHCLYLAGLTAQGCWDELGTYEREAIEKFADIIVRECAQVADIERDTSAGCGYVTYTDGQRIKKHFGVDV
jgi:hypothetical protein